MKRKVTEPGRRFGPSRRQQAMHASTATTSTKTKEFYRGVIGSVRFIDWSKARAELERRVRGGET